MANKDANKPVYSKTSQLPHEPPWCKAKKEGALSPTFDKLPRQAYGGFAHDSLVGLFELYIYNQYKYTHLQMYDLLLTHHNNSSHTNSNGH